MFLEPYSDTLSAIPDHISNTFPLLFIYKTRLKKNNWYSHFIVWKEKAIYKHYFYFLRWNFSRLENQCGRHSQLFFTLYFQTCTLHAHLRKHDRCELPTESKKRPNNKYLGYKILLSHYYNLCLYNNCHTELFLHSCFPIRKDLSHFGELRAFFKKKISYRAFALLYFNLFCHEVFRTGNIIDLWSP